MEDSVQSNIFWKDKQNDSLNKYNMASKLLTLKGMGALSKIYNTQEGNTNQPIIINSPEKFKQVISEIIKVYDNKELSIVYNFEDKEDGDVKPYNTVAIKVEKREFVIHLILVCYCMQEIEWQNCQLGPSVIHIIKYAVEDSIREMEMLGCQACVYYPDFPFVKIKSEGLDLSYVSAQIDELELLTPVYLFGCAKDLFGMPNLSNNLFTDKDEEDVSSDGVLLYKYQMLDLITDISGVLVGKKSHANDIRKRYYDYIKLISSSTFKLLNDNSSEYFLNESTEPGRLKIILNSTIYDSESESESDQTGVAQRLPEHVASPGYWYFDEVIDNLVLDPKKIENENLYLAIRQNGYDFKNLQLLSMAGLALLSAIYADKEGNNNQPIIVTGREGFFKIIDFMIDGKATVGATLVMIYKDMTASCDNLYRQESLEQKNVFSIKMVKRSRGLDFICLHPNVFQDAILPMEDIIKWHLDKYVQIKCNMRCAEFPGEINIYSPNNDCSIYGNLSRQWSRSTASMPSTGDFAFKDAKELLRVQEVFIGSPGENTSKSCFSYDNGCAINVFKYRVPPFAMKSALFEKSRSYYLDFFSDEIDGFLVGEDKSLRDVYRGYPESMRYMKHFHDKYNNLIKEALKSKSSAEIRKMISRYDAYQMSKDRFAEVAANKPYGSYVQSKAVDLQNIQPVASSVDEQYGSAKKQKKRRCCFFC